MWLSYLITNTNHSAQAYNNLIIHHRALHDAITEVCYAAFTSLTHLHRLPYIHTYIHKSVLTYQISCFSCIGFTACGEYVVVLQLPFRFLVIIATKWQFSFIPIFTFPFLISVTFGSLFALWFLLDRIAKNSQKHINHLKCVANVIVVSTPPPQLVPPRCGHGPTASPQLIWKTV